jgi:DNA-binding XRE family transcriptional regulator
MPYQRIASVRHDAGLLTVQFEDGACVHVNATDVVPPGSGHPDWEHLTFGPYEIHIPAPGEPLTVPWSTIRVLTDKDYSAHLAAAAEQQARLVGQRIKALRKSRNLTSKELAERAGITPQSLSRIEHGRHDVVFTTLRRLLAAMGYSLSDLVVPTA